MGPVFVVTEEGLEVGGRSEFGAVAGGGVLLGFECGVEVVVEGAEDGVVVVGKFLGDAVFEEGYGGGRAGGIVDGPNCCKEAILVSCSSLGGWVGVWVG